MKVWLCPVKPRSWRVIKRTGTFGVPKTEGRAKLGDLLIFHVLKPINGIVAVGKITCEAFEDYTNLWGQNKYPCRFKVKIIFDCSERGGEAIPLSAVYGETNDPNISIQPFFKGVWITGITNQQYEKFRQHLLSLDCRI
jgi:hypothetical protein